MLAVDIGLLKNITPTATGRVTTRFQDLPPADVSAAEVSEYAANNTLWLDEFADAYKILLARCGTATTYRACNLTPLS